MTKGKIMKTLSRQQIDAYENAMTGLGIAGTDKAKSTTVKWRPLGYSETARLYGGDAIAKKIVDLIPMDGMREWIEYNMPSEAKGADKKFNKIVTKLEEEFDRLGFKNKLREAWRCGRLWGDSFLYVSLDDSLEISTPVDMEGIRKINAIQILSTQDVSISSEDMDKDLSSPNYNKPLLYTVSGEEGRIIKIHHSRIIRIPGEFLPKEMLESNEYKNDSVLSKCAASIKGYGAAIANIPNLVLESNAPVFKMEGLAEALAEDDAGLVQSRLRQVQRQRSSMRAVALDVQDDFIFPPNSLGGVKDIINKAEDHVVGASGYPKTLLMGTSPSASLGAQSGASEFRDYYDIVGEHQEMIIKHPIDYVIKLIFAQKDVTIPKRPKGFTFKFATLLKQSLKEKIETRKLQADIDRIYLEGGVVDPDEIAENRLGGPDFSFDTIIDHSRERKRLETTTSPFSGTKSNLGITPSKTGGTASGESTVPSERT